MIIGLVAFIFLLLIAFYELNNKSISLFIWISLIFFFGIGNLFYSFNGNIDLHIVSEASWFSILFSSIYLITRYFLKYLNHRQLNLSVPLNNNSENTGLHANDETFEIKFVSICFTILICTTLIYCALLTWYSGSIFSVSKSNVYDFRFSSSIVLIINYLWSASIPCFLWYKLKGKQLKSIVCACSIVTMALFSGTRTQLVSLFVMLLMYYVFRSRKIKLSSFMLFSFIGFLAIIAMMLLRGFRYYYAFSDLSNIAFYEIINKSILLVNDESGDFFLCKFFYGLINIDNNYEGLGNGAGYIRLALLPFPSSICFGLKPPDICLTLGQVFGGFSASHYSVTPTLFGDCFANFGFFGFILGAFWAIVVYFLDKVANRKKYTFKVFIATTIAWAYINVGRGSVYNALVGIYYTIIIYGIIYYYCKHFRGIKFTFHKMQ